MTEKDAFDAKLKKFIGLTFLLIFLACVVGFIGGWAIYNSAEAGGTVYGFQLLIPTIVATIIMCIALVVIKKKMFGSKQEFQAAVQRFKEEAERKKK